MIDTRVYCRHGRQYPVGFYKKWAFPCAHLDCVAGIPGEKLIVLGDNGRVAYERWYYGSGLSSVQWFWRPVVGE